MNTHGKNRGSASLSLAQLRLLRRQQEENALQTYGQALKNQERFVTRLEEASEDLQELQAHLEQQTLAGATQAELSQIRSRCKALLMTRRKWEQLAREARNQTRLAFSELLQARHAAAVLSRHDSSPTISSPQQYSSMPFPSVASDAFSLAVLHGRRPLWN